MSHEQAPCCTLAGLLLHAVLAKASDSLYSCWPASRSRPPCSAARPTSSERLETSAWTVWSAVEAPCRFQPKQGSRANRKPPCPRLTVEHSVQYYSYNAHSKFRSDGIAVLPARFMVVLVLTSKLSPLGQGNAFPPSISHGSSFVLLRVLCSC